VRTLEKTTPSRWLISRFRSLSVLWGTTRENDRIVLSNTGYLGRSTLRPTKTLSW
jgi:hypothetical protein